MLPLWQGNEGFLLFRAEKSKRAVERLSKLPVGLPKEASEAQRAVTAAVAGGEKASHVHCLRFYRALQVACVFFE